MCKTTARHRCRLYNVLLAVSCIVITALFPRLSLALPAFAARPRVDDRGEDLCAPRLTYERAVGKRAESRVFHAALCVIGLSVGGENGRNKLVAAQL